MNRVAIPVSGMHCQSCELTIGNKIKELEGVLEVKVSRKKKLASVTFGNPTTEKEVRQAITSSGYSVGATEDVRPYISKQPQAWLGVAISAVVVFFGATLLANTGLGAIGNSIAFDGTIWVAVLIGLAAGLSTCMALVGGLVLGVSAQYAKTRPNATAMQKFTPHLFFNLARIIAFFVFGGLVGLFGSVLQLNNVVLGILMVIVGSLMAVMGLQLTGLFPRLQTILTLPKFLTSKVDNPKKSDAYHHKNALILGVVSFFLPCGFTQAMQLYAMSTGSFLSGALIMGLFAVGTAPGLLGVGGITAAVNNNARDAFFRFAGIVVIALSLVNIANGYQLTGLRLLPQRSESSSGLVTGSAGQTILRTTFKLPSASVTSGYPDLISPKNFTAEVGKPYILEVKAKDDGVGCMSTILIPGLSDTPKLLKKGETYNLAFTAKKAGDYPITCAMGVSFGTIKVVEKGA